MKKMSRIIFSLIYVLSLSSFALSVSDITTSITSLAARNAEGYLAPFGTMMGTSMNSGFYRKASPHKILGFDLTIDFSYAFAPAGETTYNFYIPDDSITFPFQFQFPKNLIHDDISLIPTAPGSSNNALYQDQEIEFELAVKDLLNAGESGVRAQNILGNDSTTVLILSLDKAIPSIFTQVVDNTWNIAKEIPGIGTEYELIPGETPLPPLYANRNEFGVEYEDSLKALIADGLEGMPMPELPIPGGFGEKFKELPIAIGFPLPIFQASVGLPFHTEITIRGLPVAVPIGLGTVKYGGIGGKIGISDYLSDFLYKSEEESPPPQTENINYLMNAEPSEVNFMDVDKANSDLKLQGVNIQGIDSLNYLLVQGDSTAVIEIQNRIRDAQLQLESKPKAKKKKFPIDLALGFYTNDLILELEGNTPLKINSTNRMLALQVGKTFDMPFVAWLGGIGIYGGLGFESSNLSMDYTFANPLSFGDEEEDVEMIDVNLDFPGDNKFRKLIGARMRILFLDAFIDYNFGSTSNAINFGAGITFR